ncbi:MAG TPA: hypothetical protein VFV92_04610 [Candidatus Bathyarchaeia archaeon]|nr:hypothetical protein [Candidatus Bathyarchaeia archaeon]HEX4920003.1 hypothetical protein [Candidatus Bathyarchaeia archaeon]
MILINTAGAHGQTSEISAARTGIVKAFQGIQTAELRGASQSDLRPLIAELNKALQLEENATLEQGSDPNKADTDALQSITISNNVNSEAQQISSQAQTNSHNQTILAYTIAVVAAALSAFTIMQAHRIARFFRNRRLQRARISYGES